MDTAFNTCEISSKLQLTRRGRFVARLLGFLGVVIVVAIVIAVLNSQQPVSSAVASDYEGQGVYEQIVVQPGDTLWGISTRLAHHEDQFVILNQILTYNDLDSSDLDVGETLYVPVVK